MASFSVPVLVAYRHVRPAGGDDGEQARLHALPESSAQRRVHDAPILCLRRYLPSEEAADAHRSTIRAVIPPLGQVRLMTVTDHQFGKMEVFYGRKPREPEDIPEQILLF